ncbi:MAG TPA: outer membrane protein assembly factor BamA [Chromatiales bacterium]|nr:outer membrane protein assembly factor BamA [Thiotrichales bacterium]HIP67125.1 outer membrane protein assembly factor BamA [Chromatiales bacterium]
MIVGFWRPLLPLVALLIPAVLFANSIIIKDIEVRGLERISAGTVFTYLPIDVGDEFDLERAPEILRGLYKSGFFENIDLGVEKDVLIIKVEERPAIADINFEGNKAIETDQLNEALKSSGISRGRVFDRSVLERLEQELRQQYFARGKYNVKIETKIEEKENNRVAIDIEISEGVVAKIKNVNIVGNTAFDEDDLMDDFVSGKPAWWAFFSSRDEYAKPKLSADLETLRAYYLDKGYLNFNIESTQVTITPDKKDIYITINLDEGDQYTIEAINLRGDLIFPEEEMRPLITASPGEIFSRAKLTDSITALKDKVGEKGYAFADIDVIPEINKSEKKVTLNFVVKPGNRAYVRRIAFHGNTKTRDEVFRREMRQLEGGWYSTPKVKRSKIRIQRLPFVESVDIKTRPVPGMADQVDLDISLTERLAGSFTATAGFSQDQGFLFSLSVNEDNFFGTGKRVGLNFNNSQVNTVYSITYTNPYYTVDGISRGFNAFFRQTDAGENNISDYLADRYGVSVNYGIPLTEFDRFRLNLGFENTTIKTTDNTPQEILDFLDENGNEYDEYLINASYTHDTRNRTVFAESGNLQTLSLKAAIPGSELEFWKINYRNTLLLPLTKKLTLSMRGDVAWGDSYGDTSDLPFFEKYFAGGIRSVRGYENNSLGPLSSRGDAFGGNFRALASTELFFPAPFASDNRSIRLGVFADAGNVFPSVDDFEVSDLRFSAGMSMIWLSPVGPLTFSIAEALNAEEGDEIQQFQFNIGASF